MAWFREVFENNMHFHYNYEHVIFSLVQPHEYLSGLYLFKFRQTY